MLTFLAYRLLIGLIATAIGRGLVKAFKLDDKIAYMISATRSTAPAGVGWIMAGLFGLFCLLAWDFFHLDNADWEDREWPIQQADHQLCRAPCSA